MKHLQEERRIRIVPDRATKLIHRENQVVGVESNDDFLGASVVVMCAGAITTPKILLASGLAEVNPAIGLGVQNHPTVTARIPLLSTNHAAFDASVIREWATPVGGKMMNVAYERSSGVDDQSGAISVSLMNPSSRGTVSWDGTLVPVVDFALLRDEQDHVNMMHGVRDLIDLLTSHAVSHIADMEKVSIEGLSISQLRQFSDQQLAQWLRGAVQYVSHATSSCVSAVDAMGRVKGIDNCWVADASVLESVPPCTPAAPVTMEALRIARNIGESLS